MSDIRRLVLDVLKPHHPSIIDMTRRLSDLQGVDGVYCTLDEVDQETESVKVVVEGNGLDIDRVEEAIRECGAVIHSVDAVAAGRRLVDDVQTPQDR